MCNKRPSVPLWQARVCIADALRLVLVASKRLSSSSVRPIAEAVIAGLVVAVSKEGHEGTREATLLVLGEWLARFGTLSADVKTMLVKGMGQPAKGVAEQYLGALYVACECVDVRSQLAEFVAPLVAIVKSSTAAQVRPGAPCCTAVSVPLPVCVCIP